MARSIEYCLGNVDAAARRRLRERDDAREAPCLDRCGQCHAGPFVVVNGAVRTAPSHADLLGVP